MPAYRTQNRCVFVSCQLQRCYPPAPIRFRAHRSWRHWVRCCVCIARSMAANFPGGRVLSGSSRVPAWIAMDCTSASTSLMPMAAAAGVYTCCRTATSWPGTACWTPCLALARSTRLPEWANACGDVWQQACLAGTGRPASSDCMCWLQQRARRCLPQARRRCQHLGYLWPSASPRPRARRRTSAWMPTPREDQRRRLSCHSQLPGGAQRYRAADARNMRKSRCIKSLQAADTDHVLAGWVRPAPARKAELIASARARPWRAADFGVLRKD